MLIDYLDEIYQFLDGATRYEHYIASLCPFHSESRASFFVYQNNYYCSACGAKGRTNKLLETLKQKHGVFFAKHTDFRNPWTLWRESCGDLDIIIDRAHEYLLSRNKTAYLASRGVDLETIKALRIGWLDDWITIPFFNEDDRLIGATARAGETNKSQAKYVNPNKQDPNLLYVPSWRMVKSSNKVFLTFGIIDSISIYQLGYASASTTTGKRIDAEVLETIRKPIYIFPDQGEEKAAYQLCTRLGWRGNVINIDYPSDSKDANDLFIKHLGWLIIILQGKHGNNIAGSIRNSKEN